MLLFLAPLLAWSSRNLPYLLGVGAMLLVVGMIHHSGALGERLKQCELQHKADLSLIAQQQQAVRELQVKAAAEAEAARARVEAATAQAKQTQAEADNAARSLLRGPGLPTPQGTSQCEWYSRWAASQRHIGQW